MRLQYMLVSISLLTLGACDSPGQEGDPCSADSDCDENLVCHTDEHEHEHDSEGEHKDEDEEGGVCEPEDDHDHDH